MVPQKTDADQIHAFLNNLAEQDWIKRTERGWWPRFAYHYTDLSNAIEILKEGYIYSRNYMEGANRKWIDCASSEVVSTTNFVVKNSARLYFRPRTPAQFYQEGIRSQLSLQNSRYPEAHCPIPIFFLFDSAKILSRPVCKFSDGNLGSSSINLFSTADELEALPWKKIYHDSPLPNGQEKRNIINHKCAEIIIPDRLDLSTLRYIYCRSVAEKETLQELLPTGVLGRYQGIIIATTRRMPFFRQHTFIEQVILSDSRARFYFSPDTSSPGPFDLQIELHDHLNGIISQKGKGDFSLANYRGKEFIVPYSRPSLEYTIKLTLDGHLAYANTYEEIDIPF